MSQGFSYAAPIDVERVEDCFFYHRTAVPGMGEVGEQWDLRGCTDEYLGRYDFRGKRVIDMGAASGFLSFEMEKRGAEVVSFDMREGSHWNLVPHVEIQENLDQIRESRDKTLKRFKNAYWFLHKKFGSKANAYYGNINDLPGELGAFDVAFFGMILGHLREPFQALYSASRLVRDTIIITNQMMDTPQPIAGFIPSRANREPAAWWSLSRGCITQMLEVLGFAVKSSTTSKPMCLAKGRVGPEPCMTLVAKRVAGNVCLSGSALGARSAA